MRTTRPQSPRDSVVELYRHEAKRYDRATRWYGGLRDEAIAALDLRRRDRVLDVGCGTGINFASLVEWVGPNGHVVGVDVSPQMLRLAAKRVEANGWTNVTLVEALVEHAVLGPPADAALFSFTHDVLQSDAALHNVFRHLKQRARVAAVGAKQAPPWLLPVNAYVKWKMRRYVTDLHGLEAPWRDLAARAVEWEVVERRLGAAYVAWGRAP